MSLTAICLFVCTLGLLAQQPASTVDCSIQLVDVPERVVVPNAAGWNLIFTVKVPCADVRNVWVAREASSLTRLMMLKQGDSTYQINLGAAEVRGALTTTNRENAFTVFAELGDGRVISSLPVSYVMAPYESIHANLFVVTKSERIEYYYTHGRWFAPADVQQLELEIGAGSPGELSMVAESAGVSTPCEIHRSEGKAECPLSDALKNAWRKSGRLDVKVRGPNRDNQVDYRLLAVPLKLEVAPDHPRFYLSQRSTREIPGSQGFVHVRASDITGAAVQVSVETAYNEILLQPTRAQRGSVIRFKYLGNEYVLVVEELVNRLIEGDHLELSAMTAAQWETKTIDRLLSIIEKSTEKFLRDGKEYSGTDAAKHLRTKRGQYGKPIETLDEFIEKVASHSIISGKPYQIKLSDGSIIDAPTWYRKQLGLEAPAQPSQAAAKGTP